MRTRAKVDANQKTIVEQLRRCGFSVLHLHTLGKGAPDIVVGTKGKNYLFEIKDGDKPKSKQKLTPDEEKFHNSWRGQVAIVTTVDDIFETINQ